MRPGFSETTYGYAITNEFVRKYGKSMNILPVFPNIRQEGRIGGNDVQVMGIYFQFKLSDFLRANSGKYKNQLGSDYFRFKIRPNRLSKQHELLLALEERVGKNLVFYIAPKFHLQEQLIAFFGTYQVIDRSFKIPPSKIGNLSYEKEHCVIFNLKDHYKVCSDDQYPYLHNTFNKDFSDYLFNIFPEKSMFLNSDFITFHLRKMSEALKIYKNDNGPKSNYSKMVIDKDYIIPGIIGLNTIAHFAQIFFGLNFAIVYKKNPFTTNQMGIIHDW